MVSLVRERFLAAAFVIFCAALFALPAFVAASDLNLAPASGSHAVGEEFDVRLVVDPSGQTINASDGEITFDSTILNVTKVSKDNSAFSLWTSDPKFSNSAGTVDWSGGTPSAISSAGTILTITFKGIAKGTGKVSVAKGSVLAADGKGSETYKNGGTASYDITDAPAAPADTTDTTAADTGGGVGPVPLAPNINSPTHPKEDQWYSTSTAIFTWNILAEDTDVRTLLSQTDGDTPTKNWKKIGTTTAYTNVPDGVSYFYAQLKNDSGWGAVGKRKIQVDTVPPHAFTLSMQGSGSAAKLAFKTDDDLSGMDRYEVVLGNAIAETIPAANNTDGTAPVPVQKGGQTDVVVRAYDKAGNKTEAKATLNLPKVDPPSDGTSQAPTGFWTWERILLMLLFLILGGLIVWVMRTRSRDATLKAIILHRVAEMGDRNDRVFSAMREQFEQMIKELDKKPQLTPEEREFWEETKEVLDIAEDQINSGISELKKTIREG